MEKKVLIMREATFFPVASLNILVKYLLKDQGMTIKGVKKVLAKLNTTKKINLGRGFKTPIPNLFF